MKNWRDQNVGPYTDEDVATEIRFDGADGESMTVQNAPDADINELVRRFGVKDGSTLPAEILYADIKTYGDFSEAPDLRTVLDQTRNATQLFNNLPAKIRRQFNNDPIEMLEWVQDEKNAEEAVTIGLLTKRPTPTKLETQPPAPPKEPTT